MDHWKPSSAASADEEDIYEDLNRTELYQLCRRAGVQVDPAWDRQQLITAIQDLSPDDVVSHHIDELREALMGLISQYWRTLQPQLKCPAKYMKHFDPAKCNPRPCFGCSDIQVMTCVATEEPSNLQRIYQIRREQNERRNS